MPPAECDAWLDGRCQWVNSGSVGAGGQEDAHPDDPVLVVAGGEEVEPRVPSLGREVLISDLAFGAGAVGVVGASWLVLTGTPTPYLTFSQTPDPRPCA